MNINIIRYHIDHTEDISTIRYECEQNTNMRPAWIHVLDPTFKASFLTIATETISSILYKRFTGNFYYPYDMSKDEEARFYKYFSKFYDEFTLKNNLPMAKFLLEKMKVLDIPCNASILDLGAGTGIFSDLAVSEGFNNVTLFDISDSMLGIARQKQNLKDKTILVGDITKYSLNSKFDVVVSIMMFDAISDGEIEIVLSKISNSLNPNGTLLLIEDKERLEFAKYFKTVDKGFIEINKSKNFSKYYFIGTK